MLIALDTSFKIQYSLAATLVVGAFSITTTKTALASNNNNGNTVTAQINKQKAKQSGWDNTQEQEAQNTICTHPGENATCVQEGVVTPTPTPTTIQVSGQGDGRNFCPGTTESLPASITFSVLKSGSYLFICLFILTDRYNISHFITVIIMKNIYYQ